jgi:hypothetical protein
MDVVSVACPSRHHSFSPLSIQPQIKAFPAVQAGRIESAVLGVGLGDQAFVAHACMASSMTWRTVGQSSI